MSASSSSSSEREVAKEKKEEKPKETKKSSKKGEKESGATGKKKDSQNGKKKDSKKDIKVEVDSANAERTLLRNVSEKLKVDTARKLKQSPSKTDVQNEIQSPRNPTQNAMGKSEAHPELFMACFEGDLAKVKKLLAEDSKLIKVVDPSHGTTLLHHAASGGSAEVVSLLLELGAKINHTDNDNVGAIHYAAIHGQADVIAVLIKKKTKLLDALTDKLIGSPAGSPLFLAAFFNHLKAFKELLNGGADISVRDGEKRTLLHFIISKNRMMMFNALLSHANIKKVIDETDAKGDTALHYAIANKNTSLIDSLVNAGANVNVADAEQVTPIIAATKQNLFASVKLLITKGAKVLAKDKTGRQALNYASEMGFDDIIYYMVNSGADVGQLYNGKNKKSLEAKVDDKTDKYGFFVNQPLYKKLIVVPNDDKEEVSEKVNNKYVKTFSKEPKKFMKDKATIKKLRSTVIKGELPTAARKLLWKKFLVESNNSLEELPDLDDYFGKELDAKHMIQIDKDIERCLRVHKDFNVRYGPGQCRLYKLLRAYAAYDNETFYTQGMSTVGAILLLHFDDDKEAFHAMVHLFQKWKLHDWYRNDLEGLRNEVFVVFTGIMSKYVKKTKQQLDSLHISPSLFLTPWCLELFFSNLPYELVIRFWDLYIMNGYTTFYRLCLALLKLNEDAIWEATDMEGIHMILKGNPVGDFDYDKVLKTALNKKWKWTEKNLAKFLEQGKDQMLTGMKARSEERSDDRKSVSNGKKKKE